jgi:hypothetical protein
MNNVSKYTKIRGICHQSVPGNEANTGRMQYTVELYAFTYPLLYNL